MKALLLALFLAPTFAHADVSVPRAKQYLWTVYDVTQSGGGVGTHSLGAFMPAGAIITDAWVYINTKFASGGTESLGFQCSGTNNLMAANTVKTITADKVLSSHLGSVQFGVGGSGAVIGQGIASSTNGIVALNAGYGSVPAACEVAATVATTAYTAGKATLIIEYFVK